MKKTLECSENLTTYNPICNDQKRKEKSMSEGEGIPEKEGRRISTKLERPKERFEGHEQPQCEATLTVVTRKFHGSIDTPNCRQQCLAADNGSLRDSEEGNDILEESARSHCR